MRAEGKNDREASTWAKESLFSSATDCQGRVPSACHGITKLTRPSVGGAHLFPSHLPRWQSGGDQEPLPPPLFVLKLQILALILDDPNVPSTPCQNYKTGNSGFGEARV